MEGRVFFRYSTAVDEDPDIAEPEPEEVWPLREMNPFVLI